ncbi:MAG: hypothetical protein LBT39_01435, partial [Treponema sp.]|nr:hypothetical protein [Treponema sp.]
LAIIRRLFPNANIPSQLSLGIGVFVPALLVSAGVIVYMELLDPRTSHGGAHIRGAILACAGAYLLSSLLSIRFPLSMAQFSRLLFPGMRNFAAVLASLYLWIFVIYLRDLFRVRELFESHTRRFQGVDLQRVMLEDASIMTGAAVQVRFMTRVYGIQLVVVSLFVLAGIFIKAPLSLFQQVLTIVVLAGAAVIFSLLNLFRQEQFFAGEGIAAPETDRRKRMGAGVAFCIIAALLAALIASDDNIFPISIITSIILRFFRYLAGLYTPIEVETDLSFSTATHDAPNPQDMMQSLGLGEGEPWPFWDYLPYIVGAIVAVLFLWFMVKPLFGLSPDSKEVPLLLRIARMFKGGFSGIRRALKDFFASLGKRSSAIRVNISDGDVRSMAADLLASWSRARKRDLRQSLNLFARLILWGGQRHQAVWKPSMAPGEYCAVLSTAVLTADAAPDAAPNAKDAPGDQADRTAANIRRCGEIFEEALYGPQVPDKKAQREFRELVEGITG